MSSYSVVSLPEWVGTLVRGAEERGGVLQDDGWMGKDEKQWEMVSRKRESWFQEWEDGICDGPVKLACRDGASPP